MINKFKDIGTRQYLNKKIGEVLGNGLIKGDGNKGLANVLTKAGVKNFNFINNGNQNSFVIEIA